MIGAPLTTVIEVMVSEICLILPSKIGEYDQHLMSIFLKFGETTKEKLYININTVDIRLIDDD